MPFSKLSKLPSLLPLVGTCLANILTPFPVTASAGALKFQPVLDFTSSSCYQTAAIGTDGQLNSGVEPNWAPIVPDPFPIPTPRAGGDNENFVFAATNESETRSLLGSPYIRGGCRDADRLEHSQTYVRERCNHGWCAYVYGYYFEADIGPGNAHKHDWEHVIVWTLNDNVFFVSWSAHGDYTTHHSSAMQFQDGSHPKIVYHLGGWGTHSLRKAEASDKDVENYTGRWVAAPLVSLEMMECEVNRKLLNNNWGSAHSDLNQLGSKLEKWMPWDARVNEHFNPWEPLVPDWAVRG
ncbi:necrosis inducing protein [Aspergillus pseudoustus]|uniref:Necrosis inducing protein n=1 Tax=Aspergillus pseudoustus TaxID=1810923 RepID=A0ABR4KPY5_9EURO